MAEPPGMTYVAVRAVDYPPGSGVRAYNRGDLVPESAVVGEDAWLDAGVDVELREGASPSRPPRNAPHAAWADFAVSQGMDRDEADAAPRKDLIARYGEPEPPPPGQAEVVPESATPAAQQVTPPAEGDTGAGAG